MEKEFWKVDFGQEDVDDRFIIFLTEMDDGDSDSDDDNNDNNPEAKE